MRLVAPLAVTAVIVLQTASNAHAQGADDIFDLGEIVVIGTRIDGTSNVGSAVISKEQLQAFERITLEQAVNLAPGVSSNLDANGRRNEYDIFVRGFGRLQVPLMIDGVRVYLPADNRIDFGRFLTADVAAVQIRKGYASVLDGPGAMGGVINLVTRVPTRPFEAEGGLSVGGRSDLEGSNGYLLIGSRQENFYVQGSASYLERDSWSLSDDYSPVPGSLQATGERLGSDTLDWRLNFKVGYTPDNGNEYTINYTRQQGEKGAPLNVYNNPPVPGNSFWDWPYWDVENVSLLTNTKLGDDAYLKAKLYANSFENGLDAYDDSTYTTQSAMGRFHSPYDDNAYGAGIEFGTTRFDANTLKLAVHYREDLHREQQTSRPTNPTLSFTEPEQEQTQTTWSVAIENTYRANDDVDIVAGISYDDYRITKAQEFNATAGLFEHPKGGADAFNWQTAVIWRYTVNAELHGSISDRARFPTIFELYSTRFGTATPNPDLGPEHATNFEVGWNWTAAAGAQLGGAMFYSDIRDLVQTVVLPDTTTQAQNVGDGRYYGFELSYEVRPGESWRTGGNYTYIRREIEDVLQPNLRAAGVPTHKLFLYVEWQAAGFRVMPNIEFADDRWSDVVTTPAPAFPYVETGAYTLLNIDARYAFRDRIEFGVGLKNLVDDHYELV